VDPFQKGSIFSFGYVVLVQGLSYSELFMDSVRGVVIEEQLRGILSLSVAAEGFYLLGGGCFD
jgi:hypothetical protein